MTHSETILTDESKRKKCFFRLNCHFKLEVNDFCPHEHPIIFDLCCLLNSVLFSFYIFTQNSRFVCFCLSTFSGMMMIDDDDDDDDVVTSCCHLIILWFHRIISNMI